MHPCHHTKILLYKVFFIYKSIGVGACNYASIFIFYFLLFTFILLPTLSHAQKNKSQLEKEKKEIIKKIKETSKILEGTKIKKKASIGQLYALKQQIKDRRSLINSISEEINFLEDEIGENEEIITALASDLQKLKEEYAAMIYAAYKARNSYDKLTFIFSAKTFNQLIMRLKYFEQYSEARKTQVQQIEKVKEALSVEKNGLTKKKKEKESLLRIQMIEAQNLITLKSEKNEIVKKLIGREKELIRKLENRNKALLKLEKLIADIVKKAVRKSSSGKLMLTPEAAMLSSSFEGNKTRLIWPVKHGFVSRKFGRQQHPVLKKVIIDNLGVDIQTNNGEPVRAVFKGKVSAVASVPGINQVVMIQHGEYFTVYARLKNVKVKTGQTVNTRDLLGEVYTDKDGISEIQFQVWKSHTKMDPEEWLYKK